MVEYFVPANYDFSTDKDAWEPITSKHDRLYLFYQQQWVEQEAPPKPQLDLSQVAQEDRDENIPELEEIQFFRTENQRIGIVRQEYIDLYDFLDSVKPFTFRVARVVTGQPGIGKTWFRSYALQRRLRERKPTLYYDDCRDRAVLFCEQGCFELVAPGGQSVLTHSVWMLLATSIASDVPTFLRAQLSKAMIVFTTPPESRRWRSWMKRDVTTQTLKMKEWTRAELQIGCFLYGIPWTKVTSLVDNLCPAVCISFQVGDDASVVQLEISAIKDEFEDMSIQDIRSYLSSARPFPINTSTSNRLAVISRNGQSPSASPSIAFISDYIMKSLLRTLKRLSSQEQVELYKSVRADSRLSGLAGFVYESYGISEIIRSGISATLSKMVMDESDGSRPGLQTERPHSSASHLYYITSRDDAHGPSDGFLSLNVKFVKQTTFESRIFGHPWTDVVEEDVLYVPESAKDIPIHCFFAHEDVLYLLQFTVDVHHDIDPKISLLERLFTLPTFPHKWRIVFVQPVERHLTSTYVPELKDVTRWSLVFPVSGVPELPVLDH